ncbi:MAG: 2OG-Fe(II) oxygenase [Pseudomonadota bacterium]
MNPLAPEPRIAAPTEDALDWSEVAGDLDAHGHADLGPLLTREQAEALAADYDREDLYRSHIRMQRHGFGQGEYKYFADPLPPVISELRSRLYPGLARIADDWEARLNTGRRWPETHADLIAACRDAGQTRPTPLILRYGPGDYNCLHQDVYGELTFPLQVVILLNDPTEFEGGAFVLTEQRPRMQSRVETPTLRQGRGLVFPVNERPRRGSRGFYRVKQRHGVSRVVSGRRATLGIIFHDAS